MLLKTSDFIPCHSNRSQLLSSKSKDTMCTLVSGQPLMGFPWFSQRCASSPPRNTSSSTKVMCILQEGNHFLLCIFLRWAIASLKTETKSYPKSIWSRWAMGPTYHYYWESLACHFLSLTSDRSTSLQTSFFFQTREPLLLCMWPTIISAKLHRKENPWGEYPQNFETVACPARENFYC